MIHDIIVPINPDPNGRPWPAESYATSLASMLNARLTAVAPGLGRTLPLLGAELPFEVIDEIQKSSEDNARKALSRFEERAGKAKVAVEHQVAHAAPAEFADLFAVKARTCDLAVVPQPQEEGVREWEIVQAALFDSGRPVLVVPYIHQGAARLERVLIAWDGSKEAARAVHDALPLVTRAKAIEIVTISTEQHRRKDTVPGAELASHLMRHGLKPTARMLSGTEIGVSEVRLSHAADEAADLIVMGGYAHLRLRDFVFGGATMGLLNAMTVPVLMAH